MISSTHPALFILRQCSAAEGLNMRDRFDLLDAVLQRESAKAFTQRVEPPSVQMPNSGPDLEPDNLRHKRQGFGPGLAILGEYVGARLDRARKASDLVDSYEPFRQALRSLSTNSNIEASDTGKFQPAVSEPWRKALETALQKTRIIVGDVIRANSQFHKLDEIQVEKLSTRPDADMMEAIFIANSQIRIENFLSEHGKGFADMRLRYGDDQSGLRDKVTKMESGEYRISAYKIHTDDGKLLLEMKQDGHVVTYNEDGTVLRELSRVDVCAELSGGSVASRFGKMAALAYSDDKDLQLY